MLVNVVNECCSQDDASFKNKVSVLTYRVGYPV